MDIYDDEVYDDMDEYWYMQGAEADTDYWNDIYGAKDCLNQEWQSEIMRRRQEELPFEERYFLQRVRQEKEFGILWFCKSCKTEYRVKALFGNLFCSTCLGRLIALRYLPYSNPKIGYWILDDASDFECEERGNDTDKEESQADY